MKFPTITTDAQLAALPPYVTDPARPNVKSYKRFCGGGLYVVVSSTGAKSLRAGFKIRGASQTHTFGLFPAISLANARDQLERLREDLTHEVDPRERIYAKRDTKGHRFEATARAWIAARPNLTKAYNDQVLRNLELYVFPEIGKRQLDDIDTFTLAQICKKIHARPAPVVAASVRIWISMVYIWAKNEGITKVNPAWDVKLPRRQQNHFGKVSEKDLPRFLSDLAHTKSSRVVELGLRLMIHAVPRTKTQRLLEWAHVDFKNKIIRVPEANMKDCNPDAPKVGEFLIPMSKEVVAILTELKTITGAGRFVFPHRLRPWEPVTNAAWLMTLKRMGWHGQLEKDDPEYRPNLTVHGFRSTFLTISKGRWAKSDLERTAVDRQLDHVDSDKVNAAYERDECDGHRSLYLPERRKIMALWSTYIAKLEAAAAGRPGKSRARPQASNVIERESIAHQ